MPVKIPKVSCLNCGLVFPAVIQSQWVSLFPIVEKRYLRCPHCKKEYPIGYFDKTLREMIKNSRPRNELLEYQEKLMRKYQKGS